MLPSLGESCLAMASEKGKSAECNQYLDVYVLLIYIHIFIKWTQVVSQSERTEGNRYTVVI